MTYKPSTIKQFKGKMIMLSYKVNGFSHELSGVITASTSKHILFLVNYDKTADELTLPYSRIIEITILKKVKNGKQN